MSTILKALRRLEREKAVPADSRTLREAVVSGELMSEREPQRSAWLLAGLALLFGVGLGAGVLLFWPGAGVEGARATERESVEGVAHTGAERPPPPQPAAALAPLEEAPAEAERVLELALAGLPDQAFSSPVEVVERPQRQPRIPAPEPGPEPEPVAAPAPAATTSQPAAAPEAPERSLVVAQRRPALSTDPWRDAVAEPAPVKARPPLPRTSLPEPPPAEVAPEPEPVVEVPPAVAPPAPQDALREAVVSAQVMRVTRTWWHPLADRREAEIELAPDTRVRVREGERVGEALVTRIEPSGVVFTSAEGEFRHALGD